MESKQELEKEGMAKNIPEGSSSKKDEERIVRVLSKDIEGKMSVYSGLTKIGGISWAISNAICKKLGFDKKKKVGSLTEKEIQTITDFMKNPDFPTSMVNRRKDFDDGEDKHLLGSDLELKKEFDVKRLKKIKSYRGFRHSSNLPSRGQRTKSNFRKNRRKGAGIKKKK
jgi:ribosomal protein S13|tara:strand:+ start:31469 stop:31975 length:507 start_codon:yes stop_codon:yes gene_type:complete